MKKLLLFLNFENNKNICDSELSVQRKDRMNLLHSEKERQRFKTAESITQREIEKFFNIKNAIICGKVGEKPYIKNYDDCSFSRSYCDDCFCLALENASEIGLDCEKIKPCDMTIAKYFFTPNECDYIDKAEDKDFAFTLIWTRKESYIKMLGTGLNESFDKIDVTPKTDIAVNSQKLFNSNDQIAHSYMNSYKIGDIVISVCSKICDEFPDFVVGGEYEKNDY